MSKKYTTISAVGVENFNTQCKDLAEKDFDPATEVYITVVENGNSILYTQQWYYDSHNRSNNLEATR